VNRAARPPAIRARHRSGSRSGQPAPPGSSNGQSPPASTIRFALAVKAQRNQAVRQRRRRRRDPSAAPRIPESECEVNDFWIAIERGGRVPGSPHGRLRSGWKVRPTRGRRNPVRSRSLAAWEETGRLGGGGNHAGPQPRRPAETARRCARVGGNRRHCKSGPRCPGTGRLRTRCPRRAMASTQYPAPGVTLDDVALGHVGRPSETPSISAANGTSNKLLSSESIHALFEEKRGATPPNRPA